MVVNSQTVATLLKDEDEDLFNDSLRSSHASHLLSSVIHSRDISKPDAPVGRHQRLSLKGDWERERATLPNSSDHDAPTQDHYKILAEFTDEGYGSPETSEEVQVRIGAESFHTTVGQCLTPPVAWSLLTSHSLTQLFPSKRWK
jgi:hypothetical protein